MLGLKVTFGALPQRLISEGKNPRIVREAAQAAVDAGGPYLWRKLALKTPTGATAQLRKSAHFEQTTEGGMPAGFVGFSGAAALYAEPVEIGRRAGRFPPPDAIEFWVRRKLRVSTAEAPSIAFLVGRKIARQGTKGAFMVARTVEQDGPRARRMMTDAVIDTFRRMAG